MAITIPNPEKCIFSKFSSGVSDCSYNKDTRAYKFMGCTVLSVNMSIGFNGVASSASLTLVEDVDNGDEFLEPLIPSVWAISFPKGGVGKPIFFENGKDLNPTVMKDPEVPFYFCGICTSWSVSKIDAAGRTINVSLTDPREMFSGIQCFLGNFSLSQNLTGNAPRFDNVHNIIDVFGYWNYGMESERNELGIPWSKIQEALENCRVRVNNVYMEFLFTGDTFYNVPDYYRIEDNSIDLSSLCQRIATDSGSDYILYARKVSDMNMLVEIRGMKRYNTDPLTKTEIEDFISKRKDIVEHARVGKEARNECTCSVVFGGPRNKNYIAWPSTYVKSMHLTDDKEDYNAFPSDIIARLFGGEAEVQQEGDDGSIEIVNKNFDVQSGSIFPYWGVTPDDNAYPLIEPFLPLEHLVFDRNSEEFGKLTERIPLCSIVVDRFTVRQVQHTKAFIDGDEDSDQRPFAYVKEYIINSSSNIDGYIRGLPLNTEVLRAALISEDAFYNLYRIYYPEIADSLRLPGIAWGTIKKIIDHDKSIDLTKFNIVGYLSSNVYLENLKNGMVSNSDGSITITDPSWSDIFKNGDYSRTLSSFHTIIYQQVRQYALDNMGRKFLVCLPRSIIMERIWDNKPVPTRPLKPEIEYVVDQRGYWETLPPAFDGIINGTNGSFSSEEDQIRRRFMAEDGRFYAMAVMNWKPQGNVNFNSNGINKAMFQDIPVSEFRPNKLTVSVRPDGTIGNPERVYISCSVNQLIKRPDLALVELPSPVEFDPTDGVAIAGDYRSAEIDDEFLSTKAGLVKYFWYHFKTNKTCRDIIKVGADKTGENIKQYAKKVIRTWVEQVYYFTNNPYMREMSKERIMDLEAVIIPLTSTWVTYGPWYNNTFVNSGMVKIDVDPGLVPWNFSRPPSNQSWDYNLEQAGQERFQRSIASVEYVDSASISVVGFPEFGLGDQLGFNSNITGLSIDFGIGGVKTTYNFATYAGKPGTFRKAEYDNISRTRIDPREKLRDPENTNIRHQYYAAYEGTNRFAD
jgi:hypothetical protein